MTKARILVLTGVFLFLLGGTLTFAQDITSYTWQDFQLVYPAHWAIVGEQDVGDTHQLKLVSDQAETITVFLNLIKNFSAPNEEYKTKPVMASVSFGLDLALKLAGSYGESAIALSYGSIELADGPVLSARFMISAPDPETKIFYSLECFHTFSETKGMAFFGMLLSRGTKGRITENPIYHQYVAEAYAIIRGVTIIGAE